MMGICKDFVAIHGEMVLLKNYSSLNSAGLIKILKKYDKRTGELLPFTQLAVDQPFFTTKPLMRLVHECEANLENLFPLEAEVVESTPLEQMQMETTTALRRQARPTIPCHCHISLETKIMRLQVQLLKKTHLVTPRIK